MRGSAWDEQRRFQLVLVALPFTRSLPTRIQWLTQHKLLNFCFETAIGDFSCLNSELFLHTDNFFWLETNINAEKQLHFDFESVRVCYFDIDLGMSSLSNKWEPFF